MDIKCLNLHALDPQGPRERATKKVLVATRMTAVDLLKVSLSKTRASLLHNYQTIPHNLRQYKCRYVEIKMHSSQVAIMKSDALHWLVNSNEGMMAKRLKRSHVVSLL